MAVNWVPLHSHLPLSMSLTLACPTLPHAHKKQPDMNQHPNTQSLECLDGSITPASDIHIPKESGVFWWSFHPKPLPMELPQSGLSPWESPPWDSSTPKSIKSPHLIVFPCGLLSFPWGHPGMLFSEYTWIYWFNLTGLLHQQWWIPISYEFKLNKHYNKFDSL